MQTPIEKLLNAFDRAISAMPDTDNNMVRNAAIECRELAKVFLYDEELAIKNAFTDGEQNVWNRDRDGHIFEYAGGQDYFNKNFKTE